MSRRRTHTQRAVLELLSKQNQLSYDAIAAYLDVDYKTAVNAVRRLEAAEQIVKITGRGRVPNRYLIPNKQAA